MNRTCNRCPSLLLAALLLPACVLPCPPANAGAARSGIELSGGRSYTMRSRWTDVAFLEWSGSPQPLLGGAQWAPDVLLGRVAARQASLGNHLDHTVWIGAGGARAYVWRGAFLSFQVGATSGHTDALSTPYEFVSSLGWQGRHWVAMVRHISNGDFHKPNHGETMFLLGLRF